MDINGPACNKYLCRIQAKAECKAVQGRGKATLKEGNKKCVRVWNIFSCLLHSSSVVSMVMNLRKGKYVRSLVIS
jgi:hypothetical protein